MRKTLWERRKKDVGLIFVDVLNWFPLFFFRFSTVVEVAEDLISFTDLLVKCNYDCLILSFPYAQKLEGRVATDEDLKLSDTLRYYQRDSNAAKNLLYRRLRALANYEYANKALDKARAKNKEVPAVSDLWVFSHVFNDKMWNAFLQKS